MKNIFINLLIVVYNTGKIMTIEFDKHEIYFFQIFLFLAQHG